MEQKIIHTTSFQVEAAIDFVLKQLEKPVDQKIFTELMGSLEIAQKNCQDPILNEKLVFLYGKVVEEYNRYVKNKVQEIAKLSLDPSISSAFIQKRIRQFKNKDGLSRENFEILSELDQNIKKLKTFTFPALFSEREASSKELEDLFELASAVYDLDETKTKTLFHELSPLVRSYLPKNLSHPLDRIAFLQTLFTTIYTLSEKPFISPPSIEEIEAFFKDKEKVIKKDLPYQRRIALFERPA